MMVLMLLVAMIAASLVVDHHAQVRPAPPPIQAAIICISMVVRCLWMQMEMELMSMVQ